MILFTWKPKERNEMSEKFYRLLNVREYVNAGDEFYQSHIWHRAGITNFQITKTNAPFRRPIESWPDLTAARAEVETLKSALLNLSKSYDKSYRDWSKKTNKLKSEIETCNDLIEGLTSVNQRYESEIATLRERFEQWVKGGKPKLGDVLKLTEEALKQ